MKLKMTFMGVAMAGVLCACSQAEAPQASRVSSDQSHQSEFERSPSGVYSVDPTHAYIVFTYSHHGYSTPFLRWRNWDSRLNWNDENPSDSSVSVDIKIANIDSGVDVFDDHLKQERWFNEAAFPKASFKSTSIVQKTETTGTMTGDLFLKGITKPVTLDVKFNKAAFDQRSGSHKIGFSAKGTLNRSDWDLGGGVPSISDAVELIIEAEYLMPSQKGTQ